mmetsp:Transcript_82643/g.221582  ORF Transcript_82643/g.221582 Transcript_82643/m.221582 type:complete len:136 (-) Transcript_82643:439-846(-)
MSEGHISQPSGSLGYEGTSSAENWQSNLPVLHEDGDEDDEHDLSLYNVFANGNAPQGSNQSSDLDDNNAGVNPSFVPGSVPESISCMQGPSSSPQWSIGESETEPRTAHSKIEEFDSGSSALEELAAANIPHMRR